MTRGTSGDTALMVSAVEQAITHVRHGGLPFVGVVADGSGRLSCFGTNDVRDTGDPTAHAEIVAMRDVLERRGAGSLRGTHLFATGEPCGLCFRFAVDHGVAAIYVAVDRDRVAGYGFDYRASYRHFGVDDDLRARLLRPLSVPRDGEPFTHYLTLNTINTINNEGTSS
ncbi:nucleoside deaminase [Corynebacterium kalidii]